MSICVFIHSVVNEPRNLSSLTHAAISSRTLLLVAGQVGTHLFALPFRAIVNFNSSHLTWCKKIMRQPPWLEMKANGSPKGNRKRTRQDATTHGKDTKRCKRFVHSEA